ncbi:MAG: MFS transporter [Dehalococcoidia bacterium]
MFSRAFVTLWLAVFVGNAGIGMVSPLLPVFGAELGATGAWLGLTFSGFALTQIPATPLVGRLSDRFERKTFMVAGLCAYGAAALGYTFATTFGEIIAFRALSGLGTALLFPVALAYVGDITPTGREGFYMGTFSMAQILSFGTGPLLGGIVLDASGIDGTFLTMFATTAFAAMAVTALLPRAPRRHYPRPASGSPLAHILRSPPVRASVAYYGVWGVGMGAAFAFMAIFLQEKLDASGLEIGLVLSARAFLGGLLQSPFGRLADRYSRTLMVVGGSTAIGILTLGVAQAESYVVILLLFGLVGVFDSLAFPAATAMAVDVGRRLGMGFTMSVLQVAMSAGIIVGSLTSGVIGDALGIRSVFVFAGAVALGGAVVVAWAGTRPSPVPVAQADTSPD